MGFYFLAIALLAGSAKGYCGKRVSAYTNTFQSAILANIFRMVLCIAIGFCFIIATDSFSQLVPSADLVLIAAISGVSTAIFVVSWLISVIKSAYMMVDVFLMLGVLIPLIASNILFNESIKLSQWIGVGLLIVAVMIMSSYNNTIKSKITLSSFVLLLLCGIANGITDFSQKLFIARMPYASAAVFNFYTYIFTAVALIIAFLVTYKRNKITTDKADIKKIFVYIFIMAISIFTNSYFKTLAAAHLSAILLYPLNQGCALILSTIMSAILFKEKPTTKAVIGILTAFLGLLIINSL